MVGSHVEMDKGWKEIDSAEVEGHKKYRFPSSMDKVKEKEQWRKIPSDSSAAHTASSFNAYAAPMQCSIRELREKQTYRLADRRLTDKE